MSFTIVALGAGQLERRLDRLVALVEDARAGGMPDAPADAVDYWMRAQPRVAHGTRIVLLEADGRGVIQLDLGTMPVSRHRADVRLLIVRRDSRRQGVGRALLDAAERAARAAGRTLLVVDARRAGAAGTLFTAAGWRSATDASEPGPTLRRELG